MAWFTGTATDYRDYLEKLIEYASSDNVESVAIAAGGSGYVVGEILTLSGGTSTTAATLEVAEVSSGAVTAVHVVHAGAYSVQPSDAVSTTSDGSGTGCTLNVTWQDASWSVNRYASQYHVVAPGTIGAAGSGYLVSDVLTIDDSGAGSTTEVTAATITVTSIDGSGGVTGYTITTNGEYSAFDDAFTYSTTGGTGTGFTTALIKDGEDEEDWALLQGVGSGSDEIFVGIRTYSFDSSGTKNWELAGMTGYEDESLWTAQPSISPGRFDVQNALQGGAYLPLRDTSFRFWMSITGRRIISITNNGSNYHSAFLGFIDPLATSTAYPYPLLVMGSTTDPELTATSSDVAAGGFPNLVAESNSDGSGPGIIRLADGTWDSWRDAYKNGSSLSQSTDKFNSWPSARAGTASLDTDDNWVRNASPTPAMDDFIGGDVGDPTTYRLEPTPNTGGALSPMFPLTILKYDEVILGQVPEVYWLYTSRDGSSAAVSEDTFTLANGDRYRIFQNVYRSDVYNHYAIREV